ncbi:MAG: hypothetical protein JW976_08550 [Syntrophaceae bacterium]|nr:hypothetical protein [Syntrophaceae bacterium]
MDKIPPVQFLFRKPKYPVIVNIDGVLTCGRSAITLANRLSKLINLQEGSYDAIDSTGEGWSFYSDKWILSPLCIKKRWTKLEIIWLYNNRKNKASNHVTYSEKSLSSKRLDRVFNDIFELLNKT